MVRGKLNLFMGKREYIIRLGYKYPTDHAQPEMSAYGQLIGVFMGRPSPSHPKPNHFGIGLCFRPMVYNRLSFSSHC